MAANLFLLPVVAVSFLKLNNTCFVAGVLISIVLMSAATAIGQSSDQDLPTPVHSFDITGTIPALDVGDARVTRRFYAFNGTHGDLLVTVESKNLSGDVDIFTAVTFKPLLKIPMYGEASSSMTTKSIYMRSEEVLVLRIEARSPNDDTGQYHIRFGGAFAPFSGGIPVAEDAEQSDADKSLTRGPRKGTRRVSSVGASVTEPAVTMLPNAPSEAKPAEAAKTESVKTGEADTPTSNPQPPPPTTRTSRSRRPPRRAKEKPAAGSETDKTTSNIDAPKPEATGESAEKPNEPKPAATEAETKTTTTAPDKQQGVVPEPQSGAHLIIEETDGTKIDRPMSTVRRVIIENGAIVMFLKSGKIERVPMTIVARMTIQP